MLLWIHRNSIQSWQMGPYVLHPVNFIIHYALNFCSRIFVHELNDFSLIFFSEPFRKMGGLFVVYSRRRTINGVSNLKKWLKKITTVTWRQLGNLHLSRNLIFKCSMIWALTTPCIFHSCWARSPMSHHSYPRFHWIVWILSAPRIWWSWRLMEEE